jgi:hypothetical protein
MKAAWRKQRMNWKQGYPSNRTVPKEIFRALLKSALTDKDSGACSKMRENLMSDFQTTALFPLYNDKVLEKLRLTASHQLHKK